MLLNVLWGMRRMRWLALVPAIAAAEVYADTIRVPDDYDTIQRAVNNSDHGDTIVVADGVWTGAGNYQIHLSGKRIKLRSDNGPDNCIIDCQGNGRAFELYEGETDETRVTGFTIRNGYHESSGGAMRLDSVGARIIDCVFEDSWAGTRGGAVYCLDSSPIVKDCVFQRNTSGNRGGGWISWGTSFPELTRCTFVENTAGRDGGGLYSGDNSLTTLVDCVFERNVATHEGGGAYIHLDGATVTGCTFIGNRAERPGGGLKSAAGDVFVRNCLFVANSSALHGGAASVEWSDAHFANCTFAHNFSDDVGGGLSADGNLADMIVTNSVLWDNTPDEILVLDTAEAEVTYSLVDGGWPGDGNIDADPLFVDPYGFNYGPSDGSPCIDAGDNTQVPDDLTTDYYGDSRFVDDPCTVDTGVGEPPVVDLGAWEFQAVDDCPADVNCDETVDIDDLFAVLGHWGPCDGCLEDVNEDGIVDIDDVFDILALWGPCP